MGTFAEFERSIIQERVSVPATAMRISRPFGGRKRSRRRVKR